MSDKRTLEKHHSAIVTFLGEEDIQDRLSEFVVEGSRPDDLLCIISQSNYQLQPSDIARTLGVKRPQITKVKSNLNEALREFSKKYNINPVIQLYFQREEKGDVKVDGGYLACSYTKDENTCGGLVPLKRLMSRLSKALAKIKGIEIQQALQILEPSSSTQSNEILYLNTPAKLVISVDEKNKDQNLFRFQYCWPKFVGRNEEMERLRKFVNYEDKNLLWWTITGNGGTGKSRLALELCRELVKQGWHAGFLDNTNGPDIWRKWKPQRPTLIVVDYNHEKVKEFGEHIGNKYNESKQWKHPVRILFLERNKESEALKQFCNPHREIIKNNIRYNKEADLLELKGLEGEFIASIIAGVFGRYPDKHPSTGEIEMIKSFLNGKGYKNRPLYAMFMADACARGEDIWGWDIDKLHENILEHNKNIWRRAGIDETNDLDKKHINLLILATMTNGVDIRSVKYNECLDGARKRLKALDILPMEHEFLGNTYEKLSDDDGETVSPLAPDILGEYFVLDRWHRGIAEECEMELLTKIAWKYKPSGVVLFLTRVAMDFPNDGMMDEIIELTKADKGCHIDKAALLYNLIKAYGDAQKLDKAVGFYYHFEHLWNAHQENREMLFFWVVATCNLTLYYGKAKEPDKAVEYFDRIEALWNDYPEDKEISIRLADAVSNLSFGYAHTKEPDKAVEYFDRIEALWNDYPEDEEMSIRLARSECNIAIAYILAKELNKAAEYYKHIERRWNNHQEKREILLCLASVASILTCRYGEAKELDKAVVFFKQLENTWNCGYQEDREISLHLARAAFIFICNYAEAKGPDKAVEHFERIEALWNNYFKDKDFLNDLAGTLVHLVSYYFQNKEFGKAVKYVEYFEKLWEYYPKDENISKCLAIMAFHLTCYYGETEGLHKAVKYAEYLEKMWNNYPENENISYCLAGAVTVFYVAYNATGETNLSKQYREEFMELYNSFPANEGMASFYREFFDEDKN